MVSLHIHSRAGSKVQGSPSRVQSQQAPAGDNRTLPLPRQALLNVSVMRAVVYDAAAKEVEVELKQLKNILEAL
jgi:hypothetical protein